MQFATERSRGATNTRHVRKPSKPPACGSSPTFCFARKAEVFTHTAGSTRPASTRGQLKEDQMRGLDAAGRRRSPATLPGHHTGRPPRNKGMRYPADPPRVEEIVAVMRAAGGRPNAARVRGLIVVLWRAGLRISEAVDLGEGDLDPARGALLVRRGKGGKRREVGMDEWGWEHLRPWLGHRATLPFGALLRDQRTDPRATLVWPRDPDAVSAARDHCERQASVRTSSASPRPRRRDGARRRSAERDPAPTRSHRPRRHLGLPARIDSAEVISAVHERRAPTMPASAGLLMWGLRTMKASASRAKQQ